MKTSKKAGGKPTKIAFDWVLKGDGETPVHSLETTLGSFEVERLDVEGYQPGRWFVKKDGSFMGRRPNLWNFATAEAARLEVEDLIKQLLEIQAIEG